jgi:hypothetical protein
MVRKEAAERLRKAFSVSKHFVFTYRRLFGLVALYFSVFLFVSTLMLLLLTRPESDVRVQNVIGRKYTSVHNTLTRDGLAPVLKFRDVHDVEDGVILSQFPAPGVIVPEGSRLNLVVSRNILMVEVPTLVGKDCRWCATNCAICISVSAPSLSASVWSLMFPLKLRRQMW